jgi:predicted RNase H-like nuclease (RuvC/YqgF family)
MMAGMQTEIANLDTKINTKMAHTDTKIANIDTKLENMNTKLENINTRTANTDTKQKNMNTKMENLQVNVEENFEAMNNEVRGMKMSLNEVKDGFDHLRWLPTVLIVQRTIVFKKPLFYHLAKYDHETRPHNCYNIANYEK